MKKSIPTYLPIFRGFYNTVFQYYDEDCDIEYFKEETKQDIQYEDLEFDYAQYQEDIAESCCAFFEKEFSEYVESCKFEKLVSPKFYNYSNDSINCLITPKVDAIKSYISENNEEFITYLKDNLTSCSGFISFYSNDIKDWELDEALEHETKLGFILNFIAYNEDEDCHLFMAERASENVCMNVDLTDEAKERISLV